MSFMEQLPDLVVQYGYIAIFVVIALESAGVPMPGETVLISSAVYAGAHPGGLNIYLVIGTAAAAAILGDNVGFWVGREWGLTLLIRYGRYIGMDTKKLKVGQYLFLKHGGKIVFFGRFVALLRAFAAVLAGANRYSPRLFLFYNALGGVVWACLMGGLGYFFGLQVEHVIGPLGIAALVLVVLISVGAWLFFKRHEARLTLEAEEALPGPLLTVGARG
ncbi:DedA family protein [Beijerinckia sp. L45]|uniref:DedA family protein n=1 Tax=Beijerinckia sp. L45 TaxID=1641855 RepID=UPI00131B86DF|nr:DedA family protein [Beijerinckia sp. L45]